MDNDFFPKMTVNIHHQHGFASTCVNTVNIRCKSMNLQDDGVDSHRQWLSSINVPPLIEGDMLTVMDSRGEQMKAWLQQYRCPRCGSQYTHDRAYAHDCFSCPERPPHEQTTTPAILEEREGLCTHNGADAITTTIKGATTMTTESIIHAVRKMQSKEELNAIYRAAKEQVQLIIDQERRARYEPAWERAKGWTIGTTVYPIRESIVLIGDPFRTVRRGERLIVRRIMPRAHAVAFERPDHPDGKKYLLRLNTERLHYYDCQLEPPSGEAPPYTE